MRRVCVVGAGVVGLSTALNVLDRVPGVSVTIIADKFLDDTNSSGAGGHFTPEGRHVQGIAKERFRKWATDSRDHYYALASSSEAATSGMLLTSGYHLSDSPEDEHLDDVVLSFQQMTRDEMDRLGFKQRYCYICTTTITEVKKYLRWLTSRITLKGGTFKKHKVMSLGELAGQYDVVVNCSGLGSKQLVGDQQVYPVKGLIVRARAPWIKMFYTSAKNGIGTYVYPHSGYVNLGGVKVKGAEDSNPDPALIEDILQRTRELVPALEGMEIVDTWVGFRPSRPTLRLEGETVRVQGSNLKVVHNYGHGSLGITLSWGTAVEAAELVQQALQGTQSRL